MTGNPRSIEVEAETIDTAIAEALTALGISRDQAEIETVQDAKRGLLGFGGQKARVRVSERGARVSPEGASDAPAGEARDAAKVLERLLALMGVRGEVRTAPADEPGHTWLRISSDAGGLLIGRHGQTLDALEYLLNRIVWRQEDPGGRI
ncbi:MAG: Jag N-terminal domain-containing protein, partial [Candidatus Binatia bacterium]